MSSAHRVGLKQRKREADEREIGIACMHIDVAVPQLTPSMHLVDPVELHRVSGNCHGELGRLKQRQINLGRDRIAEVLEIGRGLSGSRLDIEDRLHRTLRDVWPYTRG